MSWLPWILLPTVGALIGYATNWLAIRMIFHPRQPRFGIQGLLPRRQKDLARTVGEIVGEDLVRLDRLLEPLEELDLTPAFTGILDRVIERKIGELREIPLVGGFITSERLNGLRDAVVRELVRHQPEIVAQVMELAREHIDVQRTVEERVAGFDLQTLERVVHLVARKEFRAIEVWGACLGLIIGLVQAGILQLASL